jgi:type IV pilus assembly protein PilB
MAVSNNDLKKLLLDSKLVTLDQFNSAEKTAAHLNCSINEVLVGRAIINERALGELLAKHINVTFIDLKKVEIPQALVTIIPEEMAIERHVIPFEKENQNLHLAMEDPSDLESLEFVRKKTDLNIIPYLATSNGIKHALRYYKRPIKEEFARIAKEGLQKVVAGSSAQQLAEDISVIKIVDTLIDYAISEGASDIHIEALPEQVLIRYRIDGVLHDAITFESHLRAAIVARIKILSDLKLDETRLSQDGRIRFKTRQGETVSLRVSILPTVEGEKVVLRILESAIQRFTLTEIGFSPQDATIVKNNIHRPHGLVLVTGPTGSGKTTTLYTIIGLLNTTEVNISTIEDPVENRMPRVNQTQVNPVIGLSFADGLRALLRQDPNVIMVGEIRDRETGGIAVNSAMTGHLVLSTLHTNDAPGAIPRLIDLGVEPFLISSTLNLVMAQRLVRLICNDCKTHVALPPPMIQELRGSLIRQGYDSSKAESIVPTEANKGEGCSRCSYTGYKGRSGIYEIIEVNDEIRSLTASRATTVEIRKAALKSGMRTLLVDGFLKVKAGLTTIEEVLRVTTE